MKIAITGGTGFVGRHLARSLAAQGHEVVLIARGIDARDEDIRQLKGASFAAIGTASVEKLTEAFAGCDAVAHCAGINREIGEQTYANVHVRGTQNVVEAAQKSGVKKVLLLSFLRARPNCGSPYHESKWQTEEIVRGSGLDYTIIKAGMIYGKGDHMLDHLSHTLHSLPMFAAVGLKEKSIRPVAVEDVVRILESALTENRLNNQTVAITGPQQMLLTDAVRQISRLIGKRVFIFALPLTVHRILAWFFEHTMTVPLISSAQVFMLSEDMTQPASPTDNLPPDLVPTTWFEDDNVRHHLPNPGHFTLHDFRCTLCHR